MNKLSIEELLKNSADYDAQHGIMHEDVVKATKLHHNIVTSRNPEKPMPGDIMICIGPEKEYPDGHIAQEKLHQNAAVCVEPYVPFVFIPINKQKQTTIDTSGGYWFNIPKEKIHTIKYVGQRYKLFKSWGHCGACANGAFTFSVRVNVWSYKSESIY